MKKAFLILALVFLGAGIAEAQFTTSVQFGVYNYSNGIVGGDTGGQEFNYTVKPSFGWYITPKTVLGVKFAYTNSRFLDTGTTSSTSSIFSNLKGIGINLVLGNGFITDNFQQFRVLPYFRQQIYSLFDGKLKLWAELEGYYGFRIPYDSTSGVLDASKRKTFYGMDIHPLVSYDVTDRYMVYAQVSFPSFVWEGSTNKVYNSSTDSYDTKWQNTLILQANPIYAAIMLFTNVGIMKKF